MLKYLAMALALVSMNTTKVEAQPVEDKQVMCLAKNIYFEAGNQSTSGKLAVSHVVFNRLKDSRSRFGSTPCAVIYQKSSGICQFSWTCQNRAIRDSKLFEHCKRIAKLAYYNRPNDVTGGALFYHNTHISGGWFKRNLTRTTKIGDHIFYRG